MHDEGINDADLEAFLDEALEPAEMARVEAAVRDNPALVSRLSDINAQRDEGRHSLGAMWRHGRLTCPDRNKLGSFLLGVLAPDEADYVRFHLDEVHCRVCRANLDDLRCQQAEAADAVAGRRRKYFQSSAGYLSRK